MATSPITPDRPLRRDAERNRQAILAAARDAFAEDGLSVTLDEIARRAGVGVGTVYRRFPDKEQLIDALFEDEIRGFVALAEDCLGAEDSWDGLMRFVEQACEVHACDRGFKEVALSGVHGLERVSRARELMVPVVTRLVHRAQADGKLRADVVPTDLPLIQLMLGALSECTRDVDPDAWRRYLGIVMDGLRAHREAPTPLAHPGLDVVQVQDAMRAWRPAAR
ncbi:MAG TPA: helix-turn-helix domain-containing protein [Solirubrobacteraceae bacterium]|jgi:AcrR family transcriptional regulator|nr:helix-turn-helix domain-containing protein [Solirubrobacteraceae bacterium]